MPNVKHLHVTGIIKCVYCALSELLFGFQFGMSQVEDSTLYLRTLHKTLAIKPLFVGHVPRSVLKVVPGLLTLHVMSLVLKSMKPLPLFEQLNFFILC